MYNFLVDLQNGKLTFSDTTHGKISFIVMNYGKNGNSGLPSRKWAKANVALKLKPDKKYRVA